MANIDTAKAKLDIEMRAEEGERLEPYLCQANVPTIGVGATSYLDGRKVTLADPPITKAQSDRMLSVELDRYIGAVIEMTEGHIGTNQLVAFVLCGYNIGLAALRGSSMMKAHLRGDYAAAARAFSLWNKYRPRPGAPLEVSEGLTARRLREAAIYATPDAASASVPQAVEPESRLRNSPIAQSGAVTIGGGLVTIATSAADQADAASTVLQRVGSVGKALRSGVESVAELLGWTPANLLGVVLFCIGVAVVWQRYKQRAGGWA